MRNVLQCFLVALFLVIFPVSQSWASGKEVAPFDVREHIPDQVINFPDQDLTFVWIKERRGLYLISGASGQVQEAETTLNELDQIAFSATSMDQPVSFDSVTGTIDLLPNGGVEVKTDIAPLHGPPVSIAVTVFRGPGLTVSLAQVCDCSNQIDLTCNTTGCNDQLPCTATSPTGTICRWGNPASSIVPTGMQLVDYVEALLMIERFS